MYYLRFVHLRVREGDEAAFTRFYQERVIPELAEMPGCLYAALLSPWRSETHQSLTIWSSSEAAAAYERSGVYDRLLAESASMLTDRAEWRVRLAQDPDETADPSKRSPATTTFKIESPEGAAALAQTPGVPFLRIVVVRIAHGRLDEFVTLYRQEVMPALEKVAGCRGVFLAEGIDHPMEVLSITVWDREEDSVRYEISGEFERLTARLAGTFAPRYLWGSRLGGTGGAGRPEVGSYQLVRGRRLGPLGDAEPAAEEGTE